MSCTTGDAGAARVDVVATRRAAVACGPQLPHVVIVPLPGQGHLNPAISIARYLAASGICVTLVYAARAHALLRSARGDGEMEVVENVLVEVIPDGLPLADAKARVSMHDMGVCIATMRTGLVELLGRLMQPPAANPPVCLIHDSILAWGPDVAHQFGLPHISIWAPSATFLSMGVHIPHLLDRGYLPAADQEARERAIDIVPGLSSICISDLPPLVLTEGALQSPDYLFMMLAFENAKGAERVLVNTIYELESAVVDDLRKECGVRVEPTGPLFLLEKAAPAASLIREDDQCLPWLDKQAEASVLYVSFGSVANVERDVYAEVAHGLEASGEPFLWVVRPDECDGLTRAEEFLPLGFMERTEGRGLVVTWAPQLAVLGHPAVGVFLTHCGWNSVMESLSKGVPMLCFPLLVDQSTYLKLIVREWKVGLPIALRPQDQQAGAAAARTSPCTLNRSNVQGAIKAIMRGDEGTITRQNALVWKDIIARGVSSGNSTRSLQKLANDLICGHFNQP